MRDIKFRVWDGEKIVSISRALFNDSVCVQHNRDDGFDIEPTFDSVVLMQFTGLKDKNGVDIYEGDILSNKMINPKLGEVIYRKDGFNLKAIKNFACMYESLDVNSCDVVIGNIYQDLELIENNN